MTAVSKVLNPVLVYDAKSIHENATENCGSIRPIQPQCRLIKHHLQLTKNYKEVSNGNTGFIVEWNSKPGSSILLEPKQRLFEGSVLKFLWSKLSNISFCFSVPLPDVSAQSWLCSGS